MIKQGELARLKTSGEDVYVLDINTDAGTAVIRRPTVGKNGIEHHTDTFTLGELETPSEQRARTMSEQLEIQKMMGIMKPQVAGTQAFNEVQ